jgi:hypothetical protein
MAAINAEHLMCGAVVVGKVIHAISPGRPPAVLRPGAFEPLGEFFGTSALRAGPNVFIDENGQTTIIGNSTVVAEQEGQDLEGICHVR